MFKRLPNDFVKLCRTIVTYEILAKKNIQIGKFNDVFREKHYQIIEQFNQRILLIIPNYQHALIYKKATAWDKYIQLKTTFFTILYEEYECCYCQMKRYISLYFDNKYQRMIETIFSEYNIGIQLIEKINNVTADEKSVEKVLNNLTKNFPQINLIQNISDLLVRNSHQTERYRNLITAYIHEDQDDLDRLILEIITHLKTSLRSFEKIQSDLTPKEEDNQCEPIRESEEPTNTNKEQSFSLFNLITSQQQKNINQCENNPTNEVKNERVNLFELMKEEKVLRGLKGNLIDELEQYHKKHKNNDQLPEDNQND